MGKLLSQCNKRKRLIFWILTIALITPLTLLRGVALNVNTIGATWACAALLNIKQTRKKFIFFLFYSALFIGISSIDFLLIDCLVMLAYSVVQIALFCFMCTWAKLPRYLQNYNAINIIELVIISALVSFTGAILKSLSKSIPRFNLNETYWTRVLVWFAYDILIFLAIFPWIISFSFEYNESKKYIKEHWKSISVIVVFLIFIPLPLQFIDPFFNSPFGFIAILSFYFSITLLVTYLGGSLAASSCCLVTMISVRFYPAENGIAHFEKLIALSIFVLLLPTTAFLFTYLMKQRDVAYSNVEQKVQKRTAELISANIIADHLLADKTNFMGFLCHELRNPLHAIMNMTEMLDELNDPNVTKPFKIDEIKSALNSFSSQMMVLINDVLDISKFQSGKINIEPVQCNFIQLLKEVFVPTATQMKSKNLNFEYTISDNVPEYLIIDPVRYKQVILNLINNAFKFTPVGGSIFIKIGISCRITDDVIQKFIETNIQDNGIGIPEESLKTLFQPYFQAPGTNGGTGLGLAICDLIIKLMNGKLSVTSQLEEGSLFTYWIPLDTTPITMGSSLANITVESEILTDDEQKELVLKNLTADHLDEFEPPSASTGSEVSTLPHRQNEHAQFLVVDDSRINLLILERFLKRLSPNATILTAENGEDAIAIVASLATPLSLVFMDIVMPGLDGYETSLQIRKINQFTPIIAATANTVTGEDSELKLAKSGMNGALGKPFTLDMVRAVLHQYRISLGK